MTIWQTLGHRALGLTLITAASALLLISDRAGLLEGRDYTLSRRNAQGDMATVSALVDAAISERAELLVTFSTPTLRMRRARNVPVVITYVSSPHADGAGTSDTDHLPNVTGDYMRAAYV